MKKILVTTVLVIAVIACACCLFACKEEADVTKIESISAKLGKNVEYEVGDTFNEKDIILTATLTDATKTVITSTTATTFVKPVETLKLDAGGKFTEAGTYSLVIKYLSHETTLDITVADND